MASLPFLYLPLLIFLFLIDPTISNPQFCEDIYCGELRIHFPFGLKGADPQNSACRSYPGLELSCKNKSQTILTLPNSGDYVVNRIDYELQTVRINDPDNCLAKRFLKNLSLSRSPFYFDRSAYDIFNITFLNCSSTESLLPASCRSDNINDNFSVIATRTVRAASPRWSSFCKFISSALVPISNMEMWPFWNCLNEDIELSWNEPSCGRCETEGGDCGFVSSTGLRVGCFNRQKESQGLSRSAKYGITLGIGIPGLFCIIGLTSCILSKARMYHQRHQPSTEFSSVVPQPSRFVTGLDGPTIDKFPQTLLGESRRLPKASETTCPICLSEYQPKETLRSIPECNHYFHANCVDEWLKMNPTCPVCRNSPEGSSAATSTVSLSFSSSSSSLLSAHRLFP
ncbi:putative Ring finger protein [Quillaja saponaria]|uniref:Ring finger protein n=1 Tax=Quillaja saponaria TaxID=32244 RepID=A0AAD7L5W0_QUISA|nr:putative Ring finger protein [Quillaja saponaria]